MIKLPKLLAISMLCSFAFAVEQAEASDTATINTTLLVTCPKTVTYEGKTYIANTTGAAFYSPERDGLSCHFQNNNEIVVLTLEMDEVEPSFDKGTWSYQKGTAKITGKIDSKPIQLPK